MYKILIETSLSDLLIILIKDIKVMDYVHKKDLIKKSEMLPRYFAKLLNKHNLNTKDIQQFYITIGPGSFMGARVSLVFVRTICQITKASLFTTSSLLFISGGKDGKYYVDAKSNQSYEGIVKKQKITINLTNFKPNTIINYQNIIDDIDQYLVLFDEQQNLLHVKPLYLKDPKVGP